MFFKVDEQIFQRVNDYCVGIVVANNVLFSHDQNNIDSYIESTVRVANEQLRNVDIKSMPKVSQYRKAMTALGINSNKFPSSVEALLRRVQADESVSTDSSVVNIGNAISLKYSFPVGVHNTDSFTGDMEVRYSVADDSFDGEHQEVKSEPVYVTGNSVRTRNWLWRQTNAGRTTTANANNLLFLIDGFEDSIDEVIKARDELAFLLRSSFDCDVRVGLVTSKNESFKISGLTEIEKSAEDDLKIVLKGSADHTDESEIYGRLLKAKTDGRALRIKLGLDPSSPDLHIGHAVVLRKIRQFQELGHIAVIIFGDFTGMVGDPTGKSKTRNQLSLDEVRKNAKTYQDQIFKIIDPDKTEIHFNSEWLGTMTFEDVLMLCGKTTVARILERDDFTTRFKSHTPIGLHEFLYPLMQAYDSVAIKSDIEIGGTDQTFNINMGRRIMQLYDCKSQLTLFMPLLEGTDGVEKMGKSLNNYVGINEPAAVVYEKLMTIPDDKIIKYFNLCTDLHPDEIQKLQLSLDNGTNPRDVKMKLAYEITLLYCGEDAAHEAEERFVSVYQKGEVAADAPILEIATSENWGYALVTALAEATKKSKSDIRRLVNQNAVSLNGQKVIDLNDIAEVCVGDIIQIGKGTFFKVSIV